MGRRAKGSGSIFQRSDGYYVGKYDGHVVYGRTKLEVSDKLDDLKAEVNTGGSSNKTITIETAIQKWLTNKSLTIKPSSYDRLEYTINKHIIPNMAATHTAIPVNPRFA